jgi:Concanavalin A-like lectin/glucanases superfamily
MSWDTVLYGVVAVLLITLALDIWRPSFMREGFLVSPGDNPFVSAYFPRRGDVSFDEDESGYIQDPRNVRGYADVQALNVNHDFCRMVIPKGQDDEKDRFFACALGGTENLSSVSFRTQSVRKGFKTSRDDYMRDVDGDGRADYCAVVKTNNGWEPKCYKALQTSFDTRSAVDPNPPSDIADILYFYEGIMFWYRFIDDMKDYAENLTLYTMGGIQIDEAEVKQLPSQLLSGEDQRTTTLDERIPIVEGLKFDGINQFLRVGDSPDLSLGKVITMTTMRALSVWVYFEEFTNNAHILDFGNAAGQDNVFLGIIGKGDASIDTGATLRSAQCDTDDQRVLPKIPSGAQPVEEISPADLMRTSSANVDEFSCMGVEFFPRNLPPLKPLQDKKSTGLPQTATLLYEIWNGKQRLQHTVVTGAFKKKTWTHVCITTASGDGVRPAMQIWINGVKKMEDPNGYLPQTSFTTNNYIGKSNWISATSQYENKAELFKGSLFDLRAYNQSMQQDKIKKTVAWGKKYLGINLV